MSPDTPEFSLARHHVIRTFWAESAYPTQRKPPDSRKDTTQKWVGDSKSGKYASEPKTCRRFGERSGRPMKSCELLEPANEYYLHVSETLGSRFAGCLFRSKIASIVNANREMPPDTFSVYRLSLPWLATQMRRFARDYGLRYPARNLTVEASASEIQKRLGCLWRNIGQRRAWAGDSADCYACDRTPMYRRMDDGKVAARTGRVVAGSREDHYGDHSGFTVVIFAPSDGQVRGPEVLFKGTNASLLRGLGIRKISKTVTARCAPNATYDTASAGDMASEKYSEMPMKQYMRKSCNSCWRWFLVDQFAAQLTAEVINAMISCGRVPSAIRGHSTPMGPMTGESPGHIVQEPIHRKGSRAYRPKA